jgi:hypothetical protein
MAITNMAKLSFWAVLAALSSRVLCGNRAWESRLSHKLSLHERTKVSVDAAGFAMTDKDNSTHGHLQRRYLSISPGVGRETSRLWPDKTISYCFDNTESRDTVWPYLKLAIDSWVAAGLAREVYKYKEVLDPGPSCTGSSQRTSILVISHNREAFCKPQWACGRSIPWRAPSTLAR